MSLGILELRTLGASIVKKSWGCHWVCLFFDPGRFNFQENLWGATNNPLAQTCESATALGTGEALGMPLNILQVPTLGASTFNKTLGVRTLGPLNIHEYLRMQLEILHIRTLGPLKIQENIKNTIRNL